MADSSANEFQQKTVTGIGWSVVSQLGRQGVQFVIGAILARLLSPDAFGLIGMVTVFVGFANIFTDLGFGSALIQKQDTNPAHYFSIFWINAGTGLLLMLLFMAFSPLISSFYGQPVLAPLTRLISVNFFVGSLGIVQSSLLRKRLDFRRLAFVDLVALIISGTIGVTMAFLGLGVWSLAWQSVVSTSLKAALLWIASDWRPAMRFKWAAVKDLLGFSSNLLGFSSINYWLRNMDNMLVGRFLGKAALGIYSKSYSIMLLPLTMISRTIGKVMFPALSAIQHDVSRVAKIYLRITRTIAMVTFPMMIGLWVVADHFVLAVFGNQWAGMIPILRIFCIIGMIQSIGTLNGNLYLSQGRSDLQFKVGIVIGSLGIGAIALGLRWGVEGVAKAYGVLSVLVAYPSISIAVSLVGLTFLSVVRNLLGVSACATAMGIAVWALGSLLPSSWPHWANLAVQVPFGGIVYFLLIRMFKIQAYQDLRVVALAQWQQRKGRAVSAVAKS